MIFAVNKLMRVYDKLCDTADIIFSVYGFTITLFLFYLLIDMSKKLFVEFVLFVQTKERKHATGIKILLHMVKRAVSWYM